MLNWLKGLGGTAKNAASAWFKSGQAKIILGLLLLIAVLFWRFNVMRDSMREAVRSAEEGKLRLAGLFVAAQEEAGEFRDRYAVALKQNTALAEAVRKAQAKGAGKPVEVVHEETGPLPVEPGVGDTDTCALHLDEMGEIKRDAVTLGSDAGNRTLVAELSAWRSAGARPAARLFGGTVSIPLSTYVINRESTVTITSRGGWAWGIGASAANGAGIAPGLAASPPPFNFPLFGGSGFLVGTLGSSTQGKFIGTVSILRRSD